jgi:NADPH2:quinone reductase
MVMHAVRLHAFGPAGNLRLDKVDEPHPGSGQVRIAVAAAGVHLIDTQIRAGLSGGPFALPELPTIPGREVAGVVDEVGTDVDRAWLGQRVVAHLGMASGGYAEYAVTSVDGLHVIPDAVADDTAVAMIGTGRTTMAILELAELTAGDVVLITAAAGGIGNLLIQAAGHAGAVAVGLAGGPDKVSRVVELGAAVAVDYLEPDWPEAVRQRLDRPITVALDGVGGTIGHQALKLVGVGGRFVMFGWSSGHPMELSSGDLYAGGLTVSAAIGPRMLQRPGGLRSLEASALAAAASGRLVPLVGQRFSLSEAAAAHRAVETRHTVGKTVLVP